MIFLLLGLTVYTVGSTYFLACVNDRLNKKIQILESVVVVPVLSGIDERAVMLPCTPDGPLKLHEVENTGETK